MSKPKVKLRRAYNWFIDKRVVLAGVATLYIYIYMIRIYVRAVAILRGTLRGHACAWGWSCIIIGKTRLPYQSPVAVHNNGAMHICINQSRVKILFRMKLWVTVNWKPFESFDNCFIFVSVNFNIFITNKCVPK